MAPLGLAVVALVLGPLLALLAQRRWLRAKARRAEVMRLALLAAEEAALAEEEALRFGGYRGQVVSRVTQEGREALRGGYGGPLPVPSPLPGPKMASVCAVCCSPTTTRCSRCKAVRYCSGKCQIIHWRQGHRNECCPPRVEDFYNGKVGTTKLKGIAAEGFELCKNSFVTSGNSQKEAAVSFPKKLSSESSYSSEAFSDDEFINSSGTESTSDSSDSSSSCLSTSSDPVGVYDDPTSTLYPSLPYKTGAGKHLSSDASHDKLRAVVEQRGSSFSTEDVKCSPLGSKLSDSGSCSNFKPSKGEGECENVIVNPSRSQSAKIVDSTESKMNKENQGNQSDVRSHLQASSKIFDEALTSQPKSRSEVSSRSSLSGAIHTKTTGSIISTNESGSLGSSKNSGVQLVKSKSLMSSSGIVDQASSIGSFVSDDVPRKVENAPKVPIKLYQNAVSHSTDIKTSVQRVVQQLKLPKISRQHKSSSGNDLSKRSKMLFPYEYFVKLYNFDKVEIRPSGLINCHNSCYANSVLQCLMFTPPVTAYLVQGLHSKKCQKGDWCFTCELENLLMKAKLGQSPLSPDGILSHIHKIGSNLGHGREEDAHEFLRYAIDAMQYVCLKEAGTTHAVDQWTEETTLMQLTFGGYLRSKIECMKCHSRSERYERMMDLTVEIEGNVGTLEDALGKFTSTETLDGENKYQCPRCKSYERARKKLTIVDAPNILTIALKRFQSGKFGKINKAVRFPENLDLAPYMRGSIDKSQWYKLYAVVVHLDVMNAAFSGHYVCYVKNRQGKWYKADDTMVKSVELEQVLSNNAYMLLYARCSPHPPCLTSSILPPDQVASKRGRSNEAFSSGYDREKASSTTVTTIPYPPVPHGRCLDDISYRMTERFNYEPSGLYNGIFHIPKADSSSDTSSLFSCSDEASCSTESTRNSTSTDDYSEYIFGEMDHHSWNSPLRFSDGSDGASSPLYATHASIAASCKVDSVVVDRGWHNCRVQYLQEEGGSPFLYADTTNRCSKLTEHSRSREIAGVYPSKVKSSLILRSSTTRDNRTTGSYY